MAELWALRDFHTIGTIEHVALPESSLFNSKFQALFTFNKGNLVDVW